MSYYTERHGLRAPIEKTYEVTIDRYNMLFDCCERYFENIAWQYPNQCPDNNALCYGLDILKFSEDMTYEIPTLFKESGIVSKPKEKHNIFSSGYECDDYDQNALFDLIELVCEKSRDIVNKNYHKFFGHYDLEFGETSNIKGTFIDDINKIFAKTGLLYELSKSGIINRIVENTPISKQLLEDIDELNEQGLKELLDTAISYHLASDPSKNRDAVEKIWDAFERLKTYYGDKKSSSDKIIEEMALNDKYFQLFNDEFKTLTQIGNSFRIRHHEKDKIEIPDIRYCDYLFNRCLSLIGTTIKYLDK